MKPHTTCCHICRTSLTMHKRKSVACSTCNKVVCKNCFGTRWKGGSWKEAKTMANFWMCPACNGLCPCPRCVAKVNGPQPSSPNGNAPASTNQSTYVYHQSKAALNIAFTTFDDYNPYCDDISSSNFYSIHDTKERKFGFNTFVSDKVKRIPVPASLLMQRIAELDEKEFISLRLIISEIRNHYASLFDLISKNWEKIIKPRTSNAENLY